MQDQFLCDYFDCEKEHAEENLLAFTDLDSGKFQIIAFYFLQFQYYAREHFNKKTLLLVKTASCYFS